MDFAVESESFERLLMICQASQSKRISVSRVCFTLANWSRTLSYIVGGWMAIGIPIALFDAGIGLGTDPWGGPTVTAWTAVWHGGVTLVGVYLTLYLLLPALFVRLAFVVMPPECLAALPGEMDPHAPGFRASVRDLGMTRPRLKEDPPLRRDIEAVTLRSRQPRPLAGAPAKKAKIGASATPERASI